MEEKIESRIYKVEAFFIPKANCAENLNSDINKMDEIEFSNEFKFEPSQLIEVEEVQELPELENLSSSDSSKKDSINSFNEYQEEPDFETLIESSELRESYSNQIEGNETKSPSKNQTRIYPGLKKCLAVYLDKEQKKKMKFTGVDEVEKNEISGIQTEEKRIQEEEIDERSKIQIKENEDKQEIRVNETDEERKLEELKTSKFINFHRALKLEDPIYDEPFVGHFNRGPQNSRHILNPEYMSRTKFEGVKHIVPKPPKRCHSLKSIDEGVELLDSNFEGVCYHGHKNGCTVAVKKPEDISQDIFKDNWMQRLEMLRQRETLLRDKEIALQSRERLLFKKEKELRILERMVKDKMKQAELYLKRCKNSQSLENVFDEKNIDSKTSDASGGLKVGFVLKTANTEKRVPFASEGMWLQAPELKYDVLNENIRNPPPSKSSFTNLPSDLKYETKFSVYSSFRSKPRPKISYDDLDSTLSADVGDSSYIVTSRKFDPVAFKKPKAFSRSASERRTKTKSTHIILNDEKLKEEFSLPDFKEKKMMRKVSENILVSKDKDTKFQDYGIIDKNVNTTNSRLVKSDEEEKQCGYLNLEVAANMKRKSSKALESRPVSWSAETDSWLQKKREAYNSANKKSIDNFDKENLELNSKEIKHTTIKQKCGKGKKFSIFR